VHNAPANGNFCDEHRTPIKPTDIQTSRDNGEC